jgi:hypothetical protein
VIHVVHNGPAGSGFYGISLFIYSAFSYLDPTGFGGVVCDQVAPVEGEPLIAKNHVNSFIGMLSGCYVSEILLIR